MNQPAPERMQCMEVWGGNRAVDRNIRTPGLRIWVHSRPFGDAAGGGDVYYLSSCASGRITRMLLADVSGHGEMVSRMAIELRDLMRRNVNYIRQTRFVRALNKQFKDFEGRDGFATALVSTFFAPTKTFTVCNAGHPPPLVFRRETARWTELSRDVEHAGVPTDIPLGVVGEAKYCQLGVPLGVGDMVLAFTDAVTESENADGSQLGLRGVLRLVQDLGVMAADDIIPAITQRLISLSDGNLRQDDATLMLCEATEESPTFRNNVLAPLRFFGRVTDRTEIGSPPSE